MNTFNECLLYIDSDKLTILEKVTILEVLVNNMNIDTISGMARKVGKSPNGINDSKRYRKTMIGCQKMAIDGIRDVNEMPFN